MNLIRLTLRNIVGSPFRSALVFLCVALVAGSVVWATLVVQGARENLRLSIAGTEHLGADIVVVPRGGGASTSGNVDLAGLLDDVAAVPGVAAVSPQLHFLTLPDSPFCEGDEMFVVAFDPATDFMVLTWLPGQLEGGLGSGEAIGGSLVSVPAGELDLTLAGRELRLAGRLSPTDASLDHSLFITFETAQEMAQRSQPQVESSLDVVVNNIPVVLVKAEPGIDRQEVATQILKDVPGVSALDSVNFFHKGRDRMASLLRSIPGLLGITWGMSIVFIGLAFTIAVNERRREIGVLRALGSTRSFVLRSVLAEGFVLALGGGMAGGILSILAGTLFREKIVRSVGLPLVPPSPAALLVLAVGGLLSALVSVTLAVLFPAWRISRQEPVTAMRG
jgi:putative ABC transport system permease protein